ASTHKGAWSAPGRNENWSPQTAASFLMGLICPSRVVAPSAVRNTEAGRRMLASGAITGSRLIAGGGNQYEAPRVHHAPGAALACPHASSRRHLCPRDTKRALPSPP